MTLGFSVAHASLLVIGSDNITIDKLTKQEVTAIYLGKPVTVSTNETFIPINQKINTPSFKLFYKQIMNWTPNQVSQYWASSAFNNQGAQPRGVSNDVDALITVEQNNNVIAYIDSNTLLRKGGKVKVLYGAVPKHVSKKRYAPKKTELNPYKGFYSATGSIEPYYNLAAIKKAEQAASAYNRHAQLEKITAHISFKPTGQLNVWDDIRANMKLDTQLSNPEVRKQLLWFLSRRDLLNTFFNDAKPFIGYVYQQTRLRNMPSEFALLPMIESSYKPTAYSSAGAAGMWQMMPGTASSYGLNINWWYDSRADVITSTNAALDFLTMLHSNLNNNWQLAAAAYNVGQGALLSAQKRNKRIGRPTDFWSLPLPSETKNYVPKLLALTEIIRNPEKYHVKLPYIPAETYFASVTMSSQIDLAEIAHFSETPVSIIHALNSGMRRWATNPDSAYTLLIPQDKLEVFKKNIRNAVGHAHISWQYHEVRYNETLEKIAHNYRVRSSLIRRSNQLKSADLTPNQGLLVPLYLNRKYKMPVEFTSNDVIDRSTINANAKSMTHLTAKELIDGKKKLNRNITNRPDFLPTATPAMLTPKHIIKGKKDPIKQGDDLKTIVEKIYGSD